MTNASIKNSLFALTVFAVAMALSLGAFASTVHAQQDFESYGGDFSNVADTGMWGGFDASSDFEAYGNNGFDATNNDFEAYNNDFQPYANDFQPYANDFQPYANDFQPYANDFQPYANDFEQYNADCGCYETAYEEQYQQSQYQTSQGYQYSTGGQTSYHSNPMVIAPPTYRPSTPSYPSYPQPRPTPTPTTPSYVTNTTTTNTNTCTYNSCNTSYTDNSINGSFNTAPIYQATAQPIIQYVQPIQAPYCSITIGQGYQTGMVSLSWSSTGATSAYITPSIGNVNVNGSTNVYAYGNSVYSLTVTGQGGTYTCRTQAYIAPQAPTTPYVSLSQIPYTGFDFGPIGNAMYWLALLSFAVAGAYLVVYYQGGAMQLAGNVLGGKQVSVSETTETTHVEEVAAPEVHTAPAALFNLPTTSASSTKDIMSVSHTADGIPQIVITRA